MDKYKKVSEYDQERPQSLAADQPTPLCGRAVEHQKSQDIFRIVFALHRAY